MEGSKEEWSRKVWNYLWDLSRTIKNKAKRKSEEKNDGKYRSSRCRIIKWGMENCVIIWAGERKLMILDFGSQVNVLKIDFFFLTEYVLLFLKDSQAVVYVNVIWGKLNFFLQEFSWIINAFKNQI